MLFASGVKVRLYTGSTHIPRAFVTSFISRKVLELCLRFIPCAPVLIQHLSSNSAGRLANRTKRYAEAPHPLLVPLADSPSLFSSLYPFPAPSSRQQAAVPTYLWALGYPACIDVWCSGIYILLLDSGCGSRIVAGFGRYERVFRHRGFFVGVISKLITS
jgi:hypothetical protein